jgi:hypothetical protein
MSALVLLQNTLVILLNDDSVALMRFAMEAIDDGSGASQPVSSMSFSRNASSYFPRPRLRSQTTTSMTGPTIELQLESIH